MSLLKRHHNGDLLIQTSEYRRPLCDESIIRVERRPFRRKDAFQPPLSFAFRIIYLLLICNFVSIEVASAYHHEYISALRRKPGRRSKERHVLPHAISRTILRASELEPAEGDDHSETSDRLSKLERKLMRRVTRLETLVAQQEVEIRRLKKTAETLAETSNAFSQIIEALRDAAKESKGDENPSIDETTPESDGPSKANRVIESFDDSMIFGTAPASVSDAADSAGAAILAAMLGGKQRMLVDVRDAELSTDPETLVQFIELAILPIAAGLEGLKSRRNRVKIVFPKVSQLLEYRKTMALAAPEVVALSTLGFDPVEKNDKVVVIVAPEPDDEEGLAAMKELIYPTATSEPIQQPVVILNYHMVPVADLPPDFETAYHLRLLSVQYMTSDSATEYFQQFQGTASNPSDNTQPIESIDVEKYDEIESEPIGDDDDDDDAVVEDEALEAAMKHAHEVGLNQGVTRAMVIRAYPRPWHVFVDTSPDTDTDFEVAATFDEEPTLDQLNFAIVECLEGSEHEDELVAQQMQQALEEGQLDRVSDMIGEALREEYDDEMGVSGEPKDGEDSEVNEEDDDDIVSSG